jgi:tetratricopeptide (TPR) repeat protein
LQHQDGVYAVAFSPDGQTVLTGSRDGTARLWAAGTGQPLGPPLHHQGRVQAVAFSPDGQTVLTGSEDKTARLWAAGTGQPLGPPLRHQSEVGAVAFSPDGKTVLTGSTGRDDRTARLWRVQPPLEGTEQQIIEWLAVLTGLELGKDSVVRVLDAESWGKHHQRLHEEGSPSLTVEEPLARERREASECELQSHWFAAAFHLSRGLAREPTDGQLYGRRGRAYDELGEWTKAAQDYAKAIELGVRTESVWLRHSWLRLAIGDGDGYRQSCTRLLQQFGKTENPDTANDLAWACVLVPNAVADPLVPVQLAEKAEKSYRKRWTYSITLGAAYYRAGQYDWAISRLNEVMTAQGDRGPATTWLFLAMTHQRLGHADEARKWLDKAVAWIAKADREKTLSPSNRLELQWLRQEAEVLLEGKTAAPRK